MHVLITGAAGFLGRNFAKYHLYRDDWVTAVDDLSNPHAKWPDEFPSTLIVDDAAKFLERHGHGTYDRVYHFAAPVGGREKIEGDPLFNADSLRLDAALFRWAVKAKPGVIVYPSSSAVYPVYLQGDPEHPSRPLVETDFLPGWSAWGAPDEMYGMAKLVGEYLAWKAERYGVDTLCIRPFSGYGEDQSLEYPVPSICLRAVKKEDPLVIWGHGEQARDFIHVEDLVLATMAKLKADEKGYRVMNIGSGLRFTFREVAKVAAEIVGYKPEIRALDDKPMGVLVRQCDPTGMLEYYEPKISLREGLGRVISAMYDRPHP
jgi:nucleoside-diphosphate-sugar epimerase